MQGAGLALLPPFSHPCSFTFAVNLLADDEAMARQLDAELNAGGRRTRHQQQHQDMAGDEGDWDDQVGWAFSAPKRSTPRWWCSTMCSCLLMR